MPNITEEQLRAWIRDNPELQLEGDIPYTNKERRIRSARELLYSMVREQLPEAKARIELLEDRPGFKSKLEERAWNEWVPTTGAVLWRYEPVVFHLSGGNYTPDFLLVMEDGAMHWIEVKGSFKSHASGRDSKHRIKQASVEFSFMGYWFILMPLKKREPGDWVLIQVRDGRVGESKVQ